MRWQLIFDFDSVQYSIHLIVAGNCVEHLYGTWN